MGGVGQPARLQASPLCACDSVELRPCVTCPPASLPPIHTPPPGWSQVHSGGLLRGTPHCVVAPRAALSMGVSRETFAVFMQPSPSVPLDAPTGVAPEAVGIGQWRPGQTFGEFSERTFDAYYVAA